MIAKGEVDVNGGKIPSISAMVYKYRSDSLQGYLFASGEGGMTVVMGFFLFDGLLADLAGTPSK